MGNTTSAMAAKLARLKWAGLTDKQKAAHIRKMVAGQRRARKHRQAKKRAKIQFGGVK